MKKVELSKDEVCKMVIDLDDEILGVSRNAENAEDEQGLNFYVKAYDYVYIWAGLYKDQDALKKALENDCTSCSTYLYYYPKSDRLILSVENVDYDYTDFEVIGGDGRDLLIKACEEYCQERCGTTCADALEQGLVA